MQQKVLMIKGLNSDTAPEFMQQGEARSRLNVRVLSSDNSESGSIETVLGNTLVSYSLPQGTNKVIGSREDISRGLIYYFVWNSNLHHSILEYNEATNSITKILQEAATAPYYLRFDKDHLITGITIVELDKNNHLLGWTDNYVNPNDPNIYNEPKKLNIEKAKLFSAGDFVNGYPSPFEERFITRIKQPPLFAPTYTWSTDSAQLINYLSKKFVVFKQQFVYDDNEVSSWSPISKNVFPVTANISGEDLSYTSNKITVVIATGSGIVKRIRIAAKIFGQLSFSLVADISKSTIGIASNTTYNFDFFNDGNYIQLEDGESNALYSNVPQRALAEEFSEGRLFWGNVTENFDPVNIDLRLPISYVQITPPANSFFVNAMYWKSGGVYKRGVVYYDKFGNRSGLTNTVVGKTTQLIGDRYGTTQFFPFLTDPLYAAPHGTPNLDMTYYQQVGIEIYNPPPSWAYRWELLSSKNEAISRYIQFTSQDVTYLDINRHPTTTVVDYVYVNVFIGNIIGRYLVENPNSQLVYDFVPGDRIRFIANNKWSATSPIFMPASSTEIDTFFPFNDTEIVSYDSGTPAVLIKLSSTTPTNILAGVLFEIYQPADNVINDNELTYEVCESGLIGTDIHGNLVHNASGTNQLITTFTTATHSSGTPDVITATAPVGHGMVVNDKVKIITSGYSGYGIVTATSATTIQITLLTGTTLYGTFNGALSGTIVRAALQTMTSGDCFRRYCDMPFLLTSVINVYRLYSYIETSSANNLFTSNTNDFGRPNRIDPTIKRITRGSGIFWSELFVPSTNINGLSTVFLDTNFEEIDQRYQSIQKFFAEDIGITVFQELKIGLIPVNRLIYSDTTLQKTVGVSNNVINPQVDYYGGEFGISKNPESFYYYGHAKYCTDVNRGVILRTSNDGVTPISDTWQMHNAITDLFKAIKDSGVQSKIYGVYDIKFNEYIFAFEEIRTNSVVIPAVTLAFNEKNNAFSTYYSYSPDFMVGCNTGIVTFKNGALYTHNNNSAYNTFYGVFTPSEMWVIFNANPSNVKVLQAVSEESNDTWEVYEISTPNGQLSNLIVGDFSEIENNQYASVLRDSNTPNCPIVSGVSTSLINGDPMRDRTMILKFRYPNPVYNKINAVNFYYSLSNLNNRV